LIFACLHLFRNISTMNKKYISLLASIFCVFASLNAQVLCHSDRYQKQVFANIQVTHDITYENADKYDAFGVQNLEPVKMDIYEPVGDNLLRRPLVLFFYGGAFVLGDKGDADVTAWCDSLAHYGYVAAAVNYRLGMDLTNQRSAIRAVYRAVQDARAAIRYLKEFHQTYKIDTTQIYLGGESAGAITSLHTAFLNKETDRPIETYSSLNPLDAPDDNADLGCLDCSDITYPHHSVKVNGVIDLWGAMYRESYINANEQTPVLLIHGTDDSVVPFDQGQPFLNLGYNFPPLMGSLPTHARLDSMGIYNEFYPYQGLDHVFYGLPTGIVTFPNQYWNPVWTQGHEFLFKQFQYASPHPTGELLPCENTLYNYYVTPTQGSTYCWQAVGGQIISTSAQGNAAQVKWDNNGLGKGKLYITECNYLDVVGALDSIEVGLQSLCGNDIYEPNDNFNAAKVFNPVFGTDPSSKICTLGDADWFKFNTLSYAGNMHLKLHCLPQNYEVRLYDSNQQLLGSGTNVGTADEIVVFSATANTDYFVEVFSTDDCGLDAVQGYCLNALTGLAIENELDNQVFTLSPNPVNEGEKAKISFFAANPKPYEAVVKDCLGREILHEIRQAEMGENNFYFSVENWTAGIYYVSLRTEKGWASKLLEVKE